MQEFTVHIPTRIYFGPNQGEAFATAVAALGRQALVVIGGGSVRRLGYLDAVISALSAAGVVSQVFDGIEPNPQAVTVNSAAKAGASFGADVVVPVGGGSAMDAAKAIAALIAHNEPDIWPFVKGEPRAGQLQRALPLAAVPTTAATASEVTPYAVISHQAVAGKSVLGHEFLKPAAAWINPAFTVDVPGVTTADGAADILSHVFENYLLGGNDSPLADGYSETVMRTVLETLPAVLADPRNVSLRARLLWASTLALNGLHQAGRAPSEYVLHSMEHALSGANSRLAHGRGLATLYPAYFRWLHRHGRAHDRLGRLGRQLFGIVETDNAVAATLFIGRFESWLAANGLYQSLESLGFTPEIFAKIARYAVTVYGEEGRLNAGGPMTADDIVAIFADTARQRA